MAFNELIAVQSGYPISLDTLAVFKIPLQD